MEGKNVLKLDRFLLDEVFSPYLFNFFRIIDDSCALCHDSVHDAREVNFKLESPDSSFSLRRVEFASFDKEPFLEVLDALCSLSPEAMEALAAFNYFGLDQFQVLELLVDDRLARCLHFINGLFHLGKILVRIYQSFNV